MRISEIENRLDIPMNEGYARDMLNESSLSRIMAHSQSHACGGITAYRGDRSREENQRANQLLVARIQKAGFGATAVLGSYIEQFGSDKANEVSEHSFFVHNRNVEGDDGGELETFLIDQGSNFDQDSILSIPFGESARLIGTSVRPESYPAFGQEEIVGKFNGGVIAQFMSRVNNRPFVFRESEEVDEPQTINGRQGQHILADKDTNEFIQGK
jgi:hypothetical protein